MSIPLSIALYTSNIFTGEHRKTSPNNPPPTVQLRKNKKPSNPDSDSPIETTGNPAGLIEKQQYAISENVESTLTEIRKQSTNYSGVELRQRQCDLLQEILQNGRLSCYEKIELCKNIHTSVPDSILAVCWSMILISASDDHDFGFAKISNDLPAGRLGSNLLATAAISMSVRNVRISDSELESIRETVPANSYASFLGSYIRGFAKQDPDLASDLLITNKESLDDESVSGIIASLESPQVFKKLANSQFLQEAIENHDQRMVDSLVSGWVAVAPEIASI